MRIKDIRERPVSLSDPMSNAGISYLQMTASAVAIEIDAGAKGTVTGYGFSSVGRYAQSGLIAERFAPRLLAIEDVEGADGGLIGGLIVGVVADQGAEGLAALLHGLSEGLSLVVALLQDRLDLGDLPLVQADPLLEQPGAELDHPLVELLSARAVVRGLSQRHGGQGEAGDQGDEPEGESRGSG